MALKTEKILVLPACSIPAELLVGGVAKLTLNELSPIISLAEFHTRHLMEEDESYKQIIPYVVVKDEMGRILTYRRSSKGGEGRLHDKFSIGVGGHLDLEAEHLGGIETYFLGMVRELKEEIGIDVNPEDFQIAFTIYDPSNEVGRVHFGIVSTIVVNSENFTHDGEIDILVDREFLTEEEILLEKYESLENWSKLLIDNLMIDGSVSVLAPKNSID